MDSSAAARIFRESGVAEELFPRADLRHQESIRHTIDPTGAIIGAAAAPFRTPVLLSWSPGSTQYQPSPRAGTAAMLRARCVTAPTTGDATVSLTMETEFSGADVVATMTIPLGSRFADTVLTVPTDAGAWFLASVTTANGTAGVSLALTIDLGK